MASGSTRKRGNTWTGYDWEPKPGGGVRQVSKGGFRTKKEAQSWIDGRRSDKRNGSYVEPSKLTVTSYLVTWLEAVDGSDRKPSTKASYREHVEAHIVPALGAVRLQDLTAPAIDRFYRDLARDGRRDRSGMRAAKPGLAAKSIRNIASTLHRALEDAVRKDYLARNPCARTDPLPKVRTLEQTVWSPGQLRTFLASTASDRYAAAWRLLCTTGLRRGELLGLRWCDVSLDLGTVSIRSSRVVVNYRVIAGQPKTEAGRRAIALDPATLHQLREHRRAVEAERARIGLAPVSPEDLVFSLPDGAPIHPQRFSAWFTQHVRRADLPVIRLHDARHSYATAALLAGADLKAMSVRLGHKSTAITADVYQHVLRELDQSTADTVAAVIDTAAHLAAVR